MALSALQTELILELLNIPPNSTVYKIDQIGINATLLVGTGPLSAVTAVNAVIAALNASQQALVTLYLNAYYNIAFNTQGMRFTNSQISQNVNGFTLDFDVAKKQYRDAIKHYVPFWDTFETRGTQTASQSAMAQAAVMM